MLIRIASTFFWWFYWVVTTYVLLILTTLWANSADDKMMTIFLFFTENRLWYFKQIVSQGNNLHEMPKAIFCEKKKQ